MYLYYELLIYIWQAICIPLSSDLFNFINYFINYFTITKTAMIIKVILVIHTKQI
jgi:hypothetical protein